MRLATAVGLLLGIFSERASADPLPAGLEALARPPSNAAAHFPIDTDAQASRVLLDARIGSFERVAVMDAAGFHVLVLPEEARTTSSGRAISAGGDVVVGTTDREQPTHSDDTYAVVWHDGVPSVLPDLMPEGGSSIAADVTADGRIVVGWSRRSEAEYWRATALRWVDGAASPLPEPPGAEQSSAWLVSDDGSTIIGTVTLPDRGTIWVRWRGDAMEELPAAPAEIASLVPTWLNSDGSVLLGRDGSLDGPAARLDDDGWTLIEDLPTGPQRARIGAGSEDGGVVTGSGSTGGEACTGTGLDCPNFGDAFVWTQETGTRRFKDLLIEGCGYPVDSWTIGSAWISRDARHVVFGASGPDFPGAYVRALIEHCRFDHPEPVRMAAPGSIFSSWRTFIFHIDPKGDVRMLASDGDLPPILDLEMGPDRSLYAVGGNRVVRVGIDDGEVTIVSQGVPSSGSNGLAIGRDGSVYVLARETVSGVRQLRLTRVDPTTGARISLATFIANSGGIEREPGGTFAILVWESRRFELHRFDPTDGSFALLSSGTAGTDFGGTVVDRGGEIYTGFDFDSFQHIDPVTGVIRRITSGPQRHQNLALDLDRQGALLFWDIPQSFLVRVDPVTGTTSTGPGSVWFSTNAGAIAVMHPQCDDGLDNDGNGDFDHPGDFGCASADDDSERVRTDVEIDIEPFSPHNQITLGNRRPIHVAVLGDDSVDVHEIDFDSLAFGPDGAAPLGRSAVLVDVDRDGFRDAVVTFSSSETGIAIEDTEACLRGEVAGEAFLGCDHIVASRCGHGFELAFVVPVATWIARRGHRRNRSGRSPARSGDHALGDESRDLAVR